MAQNIIQKAVKGNQNAMRILYDRQKARIMTLCQALLLDKNSAERAVAYIYKKAFEELVAGRITEEEEFQRLVLRKAVLHCKSRVLKKSNRAFNLPARSNFTYSYEPEKMDFSGEPEEIILKNLPPLLRFTYVLSLVGNYSASEIAKMFNTTPKTIEKVLEAESVNVEKIFAAAAGYATHVQAVSPEEFHQKLVGSAEGACVSPSVDAEVRLSIEELCGPMRKKEKQKQAGFLAGLIAALVIVAIAIAAIPGGESSGDVDLDNADPDTEVTDGADSSLTESDGDAAADAEIEATYYADIAIEDYGTITVALDGNSAPETVENFVSLARSGFYDGLTFHRIIEGFMMQGGDPNGDGTGGSDTTITGEFSENGIENNLSHTRGAISMARSSDYNSASSQFFIVQEDNTESLDGKYACFGYVTEGMDIVDAICEAAEPVDDDGLIAVEEQPVITSITIREADEENSGETSVTADVSDAAA